MAERLQPTGAFQPERRLYPWDEWLNGQPWRLTLDYPDKPGDIAAEPSSFRTYAYAVARERGLRLAIVLEPSGDVVLQSYAHGRPRPTLPSTYAHLANGKPDPAAPARTPRAQEDDPERQCRHCQARLTPASIVHGECRSALSPTWRCTDGTPKPAHKAPR